MGKGSSIAGVTLETVSEEISVSTILKPGGGRDGGGGHSKSILFFLIIEGRPQII